MGVDRMCTRPVRERLIEAAIALAESGAELARQVAEVAGEASVRDSGQPKPVSELRPAAARRTPNRNCG
jgi:hypothetical protein